MKPFFEDPDFEFDFQIALGASYYRGSDVGECLATAARIEDGDAASWVDEWCATADRVIDIANTSLSQSHTVSARWAYFRASNYYGAALPHADGTGDPSLITTIWEKHRTAFDRATEVFDPPIEKLQIPYLDTHLEGYFFKADRSETPRPTVILNNGSDGTVTAMYFQGAAAALERGYNAITFDGPGQGAALFRQHIPFRPDWEAVITPIVDYLLTRPDVDPAKIILHGVSQAGYWVPRSAAFEHRLAAAVADPGVVDVASSWLAHLPDELRQLLDSGNKDDFDAAMFWTRDNQPDQWATLVFRMRPYGTESPFEAYKKTEAYRLDDATIEKIGCPMLVTSPEGEQFWPGQSEQLYARLPGRKTLINFTADEGADLHCEPMALGLRDQRVFDWLDDELSLNRSS